MKHIPALSIIASLVLLTGCRSADVPGEINHAAVQVSGHSLKEIQDTTAKVFVKSGYTQTAQSSYQMTFTRPGTQGDALKYGGWSGKGVTIRVRVEFSRQADKSYWFKANAYAVQNADAPFFQTESRAMTLNRRPYQNLLNEVAKTLE